MNLYNNDKRKVGKPSYNLTENQIRYAMENSQSNTDAAKWLNISCLIYNKYAKMYIDKDTGLSLHELQRLKWVEMNKKPLLEARPEKKRYKTKTTDIGNKRFQPISIEDILAGLHPRVSSKLIQKKLIDAGIFPDACQNCGYCTKSHITDKTPLRLVFLDFDDTNHKLENMLLLCYNCYYIRYGSGINAGYITDDKGNIIRGKKTIKHPIRQKRYHDREENLKKAIMNHPDYKPKQP